MCPPLVVEVVVFTDPPIILLIRILKVPQSYHSNDVHQCALRVPKNHSIGIFTIVKCLHLLLTSCTIDDGVRHMPLHGVAHHMLPSPSLACEPTQFTGVWPLPCTSNVLEP